MSIVSIVSTHKCDICERRADHPGYATWTEFREADGRVYEVCDECRNRLFAGKGNNG